MEMDVNGLELDHSKIFCPACGASNVKAATQCATCQEPIVRDPIPLAVHTEAPAPQEKKPRRWGRVMGGAIAVLILAGGGYAYTRYQAAQSDLAQARSALAKDNYQSAESLAQKALQTWPGVNVKAIDKEATGLSQSAHYYQVATVAYGNGQYREASVDFKRVVPGDSKYHAAQGFVKQIAIGTTDLNRVKAAIQAVARVLKDLQNYNNDYNTTVNYANAAWTEYQNGYYYGYSPTTNFDNNVSAGQSALNILQQDQSQASTASATLSAALGLVSATATLSGGSATGINSASQALVNNTSQIDSAITDELTSFQNIMNGTTAQAYGVSSDISSTNQAESSMTTNQNNLMNSAATFIGYASGVISNYLGLSAGTSLKAELKSSLTGG